MPRRHFCRRRTEISLGPYISSVFFEIHQPTRYFTISNDENGWKNCRPFRHRESRGGRPHSRICTSSLPFRAAPATTTTTTTTATPTIIHGVGGITIFPRGRFFEYFRGVSAGEHDLGTVVPFLFFARANIAVRTLRSILTETQCNFRISSVLVHCYNIVLFARTSFRYFACILTKKCKTVKKYNWQMQQDECNPNGSESQRSENPSGG